MRSGSEQHCGVKEAAAVADLLFATGGSQDFSSDLSGLGIVALYSSRVGAALEVGGGPSGGGMTVRCRLPGYAREAEG